MVYSHLTRVFKQKGAAFLALFDPDNINLQTIESQVKTICNNGADAILIGGSIIEKPNFDEFTKVVKSHSSIPVIIFPGNSTQLSKHADAILFLSLISGRNPEYLIGEHVKASPIIKEFGLEVIPTGYILIESGSLTSVLFMSHTFPIPRDKPDIAKYHALAAEYLGMKLIYLDAGSGASGSVPNQIIHEISTYVTIPIFVGGGIRTPEDAKSKVDAGAQGVVIGNVLQKEPRLAKDFAAAIHNK